MRKILIIGAGGIGSFLIPLLDKTGLYEMEVSDPDKIEKKNIPYQNFSEDEVGRLKVEAMNDRYNLAAINPYPILTEKQLKGYSLVISCVDNLSLRRTLYRSGVAWLDLRAQGRNAAFISSESNPEQWDTMLAGPEGSFSCQGDSWDGSTKGVHFMQVAIAGMAAEWIQRWFNKENVGLFKVVNV
jgi:saccharopine dehydrogenase-like NADP-dependent oxidoreductase